MIDVIGEAAGKVWHFLNENGEASVNKVTVETELSKNDVQRAIGWLAKEGKIKIDVNGRVETLSLK
ncbi:MAG: winged helix-turn-helix domain-containing protein [Methylomonas sp.]|jgi:predicted RNA-binding protein (virulence factor B family)